MRKKIKNRTKPVLFLFLTFYSVSTVDKNNSKMEANTNAEQLKEMQLRENNSLQEEINKLQEQLDEIKGKKSCYKTRIEKVETERKILNDRIRSQEQYSRKDTFDFCNPPFDALRSNNVLLDTLWFFESEYIRLMKRELDYMKRE